MDGPSSRLPAPLGPGTLPTVPTPRATPGKSPLPSSWFQGRGRGAGPRHLAGRPSSVLLPGTPPPLASLYLGIPLFGRSERRLVLVLSEIFFSLLPSVPLYPYRNKCGNFRCSPPWITRVSHRGDPRGYGRHRPHVPGPAAAAGRRAGEVQAFQRSSLSPALFVI